MKSRSANETFYDLPASNKPLGVPVKIACNLVGVGNTTMWALIKSGRVKSIRLGRRRVVLFSSLESLLASDDAVAL
jgi:excisionase family DNA binding protein